ncbi:MAG: helix-turn-helix domain-containing protein [Clostridiales bacterium]|nr:helix-turn-helix domain-containing protein [Clostridiales bacterium]
MANEEISRKLKQARLTADMSQREMYEKLNIKQSTFSAWETGKAEPDIKTFLEMCRIYGIEDIQGYFNSSKSKDVHISAPELDKAVIKLRRIYDNSDAFEAVYNCLEFEYNRDLERRVLKFNSRKRPIQVFLQPAAAGLGNYISDSDAEIMELDAPPEADIGIRISGDSMEPLICDGEIVFLKYKPTIEIGEIGIFNLRGEAYCKRLDRIHGKYCLTSENPKYSPIFLNENDTLVTYGQVLI